MTKVTKTIYLILSFLVLAALAIYMIGVFLPVEHDIKATKTFNYSKQQIWDVITEAPEDSIKWMTSIEKIERLPSENARFPAWKEIHKNGFTVSLKTKEVVPQTQLTLELINEEKEKFGGTWEFHLTELTNGKTQLTIKQYGRATTPIARLMLKYYHGYNYAMDSYLKDLETELKKRY